ncbi:AAA family ATPase [Sedimentibacter hydroxybenzoicus DSM 7310]|uniref:AAA family ATPase n=1 Tax=Sedimentibacter hydroxybenzoicus DSM 7310 TaxID=1123245 RepID=A0A974BJQ4_SEDHY|nr:ATP-binding protein [Sedimentibacter hydroxybenzoicus]NYB74535.1 AAA family ATPase [Sedimentibacter hydroxybenzoicus DSM 7310]
MIKIFEVSGFKNFKDKIILNFSDVRDYKFNSDCITNGLISKAIIYGKNSTGKSNFGLAIFDIVSHLTNRNITTGMYDYYLNANNFNKFAEFHYIFKFGDQILDYNYKKNEKQILIYEKLLLDNKVLFEYEFENKTGNIDGIRDIVPSLNWIFQDSDSILKYVINNTILDDSHPIRQLMRFVSNMLWFRSSDENRYIGYKNKINDYFDFIFEKNYLKEFEDFLHSAGIKENLKAIKDSDGIKRLYFTGKTPLPFFRVASSGTKTLYNFFYWYKTAEEVSLMFIDEFDAFYYYELSESIVSIIEKMKNTQVILTSHNTNLLSNRIMRPDCYFILTDNKLTSFANATNRELREGHNLEKLYISGEFDE